MRSSYIQNNYGKVFTDLIHQIVPRMAVELGVLDGYSTIHIAQGIKENGGDGMLYAFDLFEQYSYNHGEKDQVLQELKTRGLNEYVLLFKEDGFVVHELFKDSSVDFVHVDISNTGSVLRKIIKNWTPKLKVRGVLVFEGGSEERDNVEWMIKYEKESIRKELLSNATIKEKYSYEVMEPFPSLTILTKIKE